MNVVFRVDASGGIGAGHVMRCLTLADSLRSAGSEIAFLSMNVAGHALDFVRSRGFAAAFLATEDVGGVTSALSGLGFALPADWLVVDHYALDRRWETAIRGMCRRIAVIDDLANRHHDCEALLDQNYYSDADTRYRGFVPPDCRLFLGPRFALLRTEFYRAAKQARVRNGTVGRVLISFGASDPTNETGKVLPVLRRLKSGVHVDVVVGAANPRRVQIERECAGVPKCRSFVQTSKMADLMTLADLAVGAGGVTTWERCLLGLPTITVAVAENQVRTTMDLASLGAVWYLGRAPELTEADYESAIDEALRSPDRLQGISVKSRQIMGAVPDFERNVHPLAQHMLRDCSS